MNEVNKNSIITEIQTEYRKIDHKWMNLHYYTFVSVVIIGFLAECIISISLYHSGYIEISLVKYALKYLLAPFLFNMFLLVIGLFAKHSSHLKQTTKIYIISLLLVGVCFVFFSVHSIFNSLMLIFAAPILLTVVYNDYILTTITAFVSIAAKAVSDLFVYWDPDKISAVGGENRLTDFYIYIFIFIVFYVICMIVIRFEKEKTVASIRKEIQRYKIQKKLLTDELTKIYNRTALRDAFKAMENDVSENTYYFAMIDLDNFKMLNDSFGHDNGDQCLKEFGRILTKYCVGDMCPFRFGGDEFCILFKNSTLETIRETCHNIQDDFKYNLTFESNMLMTVSIGIAAFTKQITAAQLLRNTDSALYRSKQLKDTICVFEEMT